MLSNERRGHGILARSLAVGCLTLMTTAGAARAQMPDKFTNLKVLPKDITKPELIDAMRGYSGALGVRCEYCHVEKAPPAHGEDFAADGKPEKESARLMMKMVADINGKDLAALKTGRPARVQVRCATCHHGLAVPQTLGDALGASLAEKGLEASIQRYHELRDTYYGSDSYNFSDRALVDFARSLGASGKTAEALAFLKLNGELYPKSALTPFGLGELYTQTGDRDKAIASFRAALEIDPKFMPAQRRLDELTKEKDVPQGGGKHD